MHLESLINFLFLPSEKERKQGSSEIKPLVAIMISVIQFSSAQSGQQ